MPLSVINWIAESYLSICERFFWVHVSMQKTRDLLYTSIDHMSNSSVKQKEETRKYYQKWKERGKVGKNTKCNTWPNCARSTFQEKNGAKQNINFSNALRSRYALHERGTPELSLKTNQWTVLEALARDKRAGLASLPNGWEVVDLLASSRHVNLFVENLLRFVFAVFSCIPFERSARQTEKRNGDRHYSKADRRA